MIKRNVIVFMIGFILLSFNGVRAVQLAEDGQTVIPDRTGEVIKIDAELTEKTWSNKEISEDFISFHPIYGEVLAQKTRVWMAYNGSNLYFAFKCYDSEPQKIKSTICQRDRMFRDDWVGILLDAVGNKQTSYEFYVNPNGIQADALNSSASGTDITPDFVWESAGKFTGYGYQVEIRIPLESINFKGSDEVKMRLLFVRQISRLGTVGAWPRIKPGQTDFNFMADVVYKDLEYGLKLEVLPNFTYSSDTQRADASTWGPKEISKNFGAAIKYGIISTVTAEVTVNPDFSQVESDTFQVEVNRRYPVFYTEKRPFFMEGLKIFDFGLTVYHEMQLGMMVSALHTRRIVDPGWAAKISGSIGKMSFGVLAADDRAPAQTWGSQADEDKEAYWGIARCKFNLGRDNSLGFLYSGSYFDGGSNNALGLDLQYRPGKDLRLYLNYLYTRTKESSGFQEQKGSGFNAILQYIKPKIDTWVVYETYDKDFNMHSAFINRTGIERGMVFIGPNIYAKIKGLDWVKRIQPYFQFSKLHDMASGMNDTSWAAGVNMNFHRMGASQLAFQRDDEAWQGRMFNQKYFFGWVFVQLLKWFQLQINLRVGDQIYYDTEAPVLGTGPQGSVEFIVEPHLKLRVRPEWIFNYLYTKPGHEKIYSVNIFNLRVYYQFNKYFMLRGALRYNDYEKKLLTDLLASFTLIPGTVLHLGYGSLYENKVWQENRWITGPGHHLLNMKNSLFFKVSYLWQIK